MRKDRILKLTRRGFGAAFSGAGAAIAFRSHAKTLEAPPVISPIDPDLRDATLRGLALAGRRGDPVHAAKAEAMLTRLAETDPEGALLGRIYQRLDARPTSYWENGASDAGTAELTMLHAAIQASQPVAFGYTDLDGIRTERVVLPLVLVHPPQGVKLLAWCENRADFRQFFVRSISSLTSLSGDFSARRIHLL
jgi:predicted DNA-binding transcriptional regulator YafY